MGLKKQREMVSVSGYKELGIYARKIYKSLDFNLTNAALKKLNNKVKEESNLLPPIIECIKANCTLGEITTIMKNHFGEHH